MAIAQSPHKNCVTQFINGILAIILRPIGYVYGDRTELQDDNWADVSSRIELSDDFAPEALDGIEEFSHIEVIFHFFPAWKKSTQSARAVNR